MESKICSKCRIDKSVEEFSTDNGKLKSQCKSCVNEYNKSYKEKNKNNLNDRWRKASRKYHTTEKRRNKTLRKYGLREEDYNIMFDKQEGKCKICHEPVTLCVDHCHTTGKVRGLLCNSCNTSLGGFKDSIELLESAIKYLAM